MKRFVFTKRRLIGFLCCALLPVAAMVLGILHLSAVGCAIFYGIDSCSVYIAVSEYICQANNIFLQRVVCPCEQMAEVMWEHFFF